MCCSLSRLHKRPGLLRLAFYAPSALYQGHRPMGYTRILWRLRRVDENLARCSSEPGILEDPEVTVPTCGS